MTLTKTILFIYRFLNTKSVIWYWYKTSNELWYLIYWLRLEGLQFSQLWRWRLNHISVSVRVKQIRRDSLSNGRKSMHHRFQNICPLYEDISNAKIKIHARTLPIWKKPTQVNHCNWMKRKSIQVGIIMTIFSKTYTVTKRNLTEKMFWTFIRVFTLVESWYKNNIDFPLQVIYVSFTSKY